MNRSLLIIALLLLLVFTASKPVWEPALMEGSAAWRSISPSAASPASAQGNHHHGKAKTAQATAATAATTTALRHNARASSPQSATGTGQETNQALRDAEAPAAAASDLITESSLNMITSQDQNTGAITTSPAITGFQVAQAEVLNEQTSADFADHDESLISPAPDAPEWAKLRWLEAVMVDGVSDEETQQLGKLFASSPSTAITQEILSSAAMAEASPALQNLIEKALTPTQPEKIRMLALHLANDHYPQIVQRLLSDSDENIRLHAEALLDAGRRGTEFRE